MEDLEVHGVHLAGTVCLASSPDPQGRPLVAHREQQRQREVVAQNSSVTYAMQLDRIDVHRFVADRLPGFRQVDDFREPLLGEVRIHAAQRLERLPYRVLREIGQPADAPEAPRPLPGGLA